MAQKSQKDKDNFGLLLMTIMIVGIGTLGAGVFGFLAGGAISGFFWWGMNNPKFERNGE